MAKKSKKAKKGKWCTEDLDFDEDGNLFITNKALSKAIWKAIYRTDRRFSIRVKRSPGLDLLGFPEFDRKAAKKGDPVDGKADANGDDGRPPANAMCPC